MSLACGAGVLLLTWWAPLTLEPGSFIVLVAIPGIVAAGVGSSLAHC